MQQLFFIVLAILQLVIFFILLLGKLFLRHQDKSTPSFSTNNWDKTLIISSILSIAIVAVLFILTFKGEYKTVAASSKAVTDSSSNSADRHRLDSLLSQYGYQVDSSKGIALLLKDSLLTNALIIKENEPGISLPEEAGITIDSLKNNTCFLKLTYQNGMAAAANIQVKTALAVIKEGNLSLPPIPGDNYYLLPIGSNLAAKAQLHAALALPYENTPLIYCLLTGTFSNTAGTKIYTTRKIYCYDTSTKQTVLTTAAHYVLLDNFFKKQGL